MRLTEVISPAGVFDYVYWTGTDRVQDQPVPNRSGTALIHHGRSSQDNVSVNLPATSTLIYDLNGKVSCEDGERWRELGVVLTA